MAKMSQIERQWLLLKLIGQQKQQQTTEHLWQSVQDEGAETTKRTVERDLEFLAWLFFPHIQSTMDGRTNTWYWGNNAKIWVPGLTENQALVMYMVEKNLIDLLPTVTVEHLKPYFDAARERLDQVKTGTRSWKQKYRLIPSSQILIPALINSASANGIHDALLKDLSVEIGYRDRTKNKTDKANIRPLAIVQRGPVLYVVYANDEEDDIHFIALHRIFSVKPLFFQPERKADTTFNIDEYIESGVLGFGHTYPIPVGKQLSLEAIFSTKAGERLAETQLDRSQSIDLCNDGRYMLKANLKFSGQLLWWLLSYGSDVEVVAPKELREIVLNSLKQAIQNYTSKA